MERRTPRELLCLADPVETVDGDDETESQADTEVALRLDLVDVDKEAESAPRLLRLGATGSSGSEDILPGEASVGLTGQ